MTYNIYGLMDDVIKLLYDSLLFKRYIKLNMNGENIIFIRIIINTLII